jgi:hypothetical protein
VTAIELLAERVPAFPPDWSVHELIAYCESCGHGAFAHRNTRGIPIPCYGARRQSADPVTGQVRVHGKAGSASPRPRSAPVRRCSAGRPPGGKYCARCGECKTASAAEFRRDAPAADSLNSWCRDCSNEAWRLRKAERKERERLRALPGECRQCHEVKPGSAFRSNSKAANGRCSLCLDCYNGNVRQARLAAATLSA